MAAPTTVTEPTTTLAEIGYRLRSDVALRSAGLAVGLALVLVAAGGIGAYLVFGPVAHGGFDPAGLVDHLGPVGDVLAAPFARWDSVWYLTIARDGYVDGPGPAFFPLYPLLVALVGEAGPGLLVGGVLVSVSCLLVALRLLYRLTELELGDRYPEAARLAVLATALGPMAFFFTAVYGESLYLALSVGAFLEARRGRWARAGALGALASATRSSGLLLIGALALLWLEQRRGPRPAACWPRPRRRDALWLAVIPLGLAAYLGWLWLTGLDPRSPFTVQEAWYRHFTGPIGGVEQGARAALGGARQLVSGQSRTIYFPPAGGDPMIAGGHNLMLFAFLLGALVPLAGALRRLPPAYGAYALAGLVVAISYPVSPQPLTSLPRYLVVLFPLQMAGAVWMARRPRVRRPALGVSAASLAGFSGLFATWHWIA